MRRGISVGVVAALAIASGSAATAAATAPARAVAASHGGGLTSRHAARAHQRAAIRNAGGLALPRLTPAGDGGGPTMTANLLAVGDLAVNDRPDVLDVRQLGAGGTSHLVLAARDGGTGKQLWHTPSYDFSESQGVRGILPEKVGVDGAPGILLITYDDTFGSNESASYQTTLTALSGADGSELWTRTFAGTFASDKTATTVPGEVDVFQQASGAPNYMVDELNGTATEGTETAMVVSGVDGSLSQFGDPVAGSVVDGYPRTAAIADLDGDTYDDAIVTMPGSPGTLEALGGVTANVLWTRSLKVDRFSTMVPVPSYSRPSANDVAVEAYGDGDALALSRVTMLSGDDGSTLWRRDASVFAPIGVAGKHSSPAVLVGVLQNDAKGPVVGEAISYRAVSPTDHVIYHQAVGVTGKRLRHDTFGLGYLRPLGDVQPDGSTDLLYNVEVSATVPSNTGEKSETGFIDGRTGDAHAYSTQSVSLSPVRVPAAGSLHDGLGTDLLHVKNTKTLEPQINGYDGISQRRLYHRTLDIKGAEFGEDSAFGLRVSDHDCSDIALQSTGGGGPKILAVLSGSARPLWILTFKRLQQTGGKLVASTPSKYCT